MTAPHSRTATAEEAGRALASTLVKVNDALWRVSSNVQDSKLTPASCAYIDGQLAKMIGWLASARAVVITQGSLEHPHFDGDELIDLDEQWGLADNAEAAGGEGTVPHQ